MCRNRDSAVSGVKCMRAFLADQDSRVAGLYIEQTLLPWSCFEGFQKIRGNPKP